MTGDQAAVARDDLRRGSSALVRHAVTVATDPASTAAQVDASLRTALRALATSARSYGLIP